MIAFIIEAQGIDGPPVYYDCDAGRNSGHGHMGWVQEKNLALGFATEHDAKRFINALLPGMAHTCRPVPFQRKD